MYHTNVNVNLISENVIQTHNGIKINIDVNVKNIINVKNIFEILLHVVAKIENS